MGVVWDDDDAGVTRHDGDDSDGDSVEAAFAELQALLETRRRRADAAEYCCRKPIPCRGCPRLWTELEPTAP